MDITLARGDDIHSEVAIGWRACRHLRRDSRISTVKKLRSALEAAGVVFFAENGGGAGVRLRGTNGPSPAAPFCYCSSLLIRSVIVVLKMKAPQ
jgi:hypothetical protein